jgi:hypothetical protein
MYQLKAKTYIFKTYYKNPNQGVIIPPSKNKNKTLNLQGTKLTGY